MISIEIIYQEVINLLFGLPFRLYLNILKTKKILQFWDKKFSTHIIPAQEVKKEFFRPIRFFNQFIVTSENDFRTISEEIHFTIREDIQVAWFSRNQPVQSALQFADFCNIFVISTRSVSLPNERIVA